MRSVIFSFALLAVNASINCAKSSCITHLGAQDKKVLSRLTEYEIFAQKYEATFGEKPSDKVWNLGKKNCGNGACANCGGGCGGNGW